MEILTLTTTNIVVSIIKGLNCFTFTDANYALIHLAEFIGKEPY